MYRTILCTDFQAVLNLHTTVSFLNLYINNLLKVPQNFEVSFMIIIDLFISRLFNLLRRSLLELYVFIKENKLLWN